MMVITTWPSLISAQVQRNIKYALKYAERNLTVDIDVRTVVMTAVKTEDVRPVRSLALWCKYAAVWVRWIGQKSCYGND